MGTCINGGWRESCTRDRQKRECLSPGIVHDDFTCIAMIQCIERGQIGLDEPVAEYLPVISLDSAKRATGKLRYTPAARAITIRHMLFHTSGIEYGIVNPTLTAWRKSRGGALSRYGPDAMTFSIPLVYQLGEWWEYNANFDGIGILISRLNGGMPLRRSTCKSTSVTHYN